MKIHFCDLCNESIPHAALDSGAARLVKGRVICATCDAAMTHAAEAERSAAASTHGHQPAGRAPVHVPPGPVGSGGFVTPPSPSGSPLASPAQSVTSPSMPAPAIVASPVPPAPLVVQAPPSSNTGIAWVAGLAIGFTALSIFVTDDRLARVGRSQTALENELAKRDDALRGLSTELNKVHPALAGVEARLVERLDASVARDTASAAAVGALREDVGNFTARLDALGVEVERLRARVSEPGLGLAIEKRFDEMSARIAKADDERRVLSTRLAAAESAVPAEKPAAAPAVAVAPPAAWKKFLPDLTSAEETVRWDAVSALGDANDPAVVPHVVPMLKDPTWVVRMAAARVLGEKLRARAAVPALIEALEDTEPAVRESAWIALRAITGKDLKFDSSAPEAERSKRVKAWSEWWKKDGDGDAAKEPAGP